MRISSKGDYGLRALFDLAQRVGEGPVQSEQIAARQGIPPHYLNQLLITLRRSGLIESVRGPQGGHMLARPPEQISLLDILTALEGPLLPEEPARDQSAPHSREDQAIVDGIWRELRVAVEQQCAAITLDDLLQRKGRHAADPMYYI